MLDGRKKLCTHLSHYSILDTTQGYGPHCTWVSSMTQVQVCGNCGRLWHTRADSAVWQLTLFCWHDTSAVSRTTTSSFSVTSYASSRFHFAHAVLHSVGPLRMCEGKRLLHKQRELQRCHTLVMRYEKWLFHLHLRPSIHFWCFLRPHLSMSKARW